MREIEYVPEIDHRRLEVQREEKLEQKVQALDRDPLPDIGWKAWRMERRGIRTVAGDLWREASGRLEEMREMVVGLREGLAKTYSHVRDVAEHSLSGLAEALRGAGFSSLQQVNEPSKEREVERTYEHMGDDFGL